jgi:hypothetical protein
VGGASRAARPAEAVIAGARPTGIPHRSAATRDVESPDAEAATARVASALARAPLLRTRTEGPSKATSTVPSLSVR